MQKTVTISDAQAMQFASGIMRDIRGYVDAHRAEYEIFLAKWQETHKETGEETA